MKPKYDQRFIHQCTNASASSKLLERAFRRRKIGFELGSRVSGVHTTDNGVRVDLENGLAHIPNSSRLLKFSSE